MGSGEACMEEVFWGIDVGTSGCKAVAVNGNGDVIAAGDERYDDSLVRTETGGYDQSAEVLLNACLNCLTNLARRIGDGRRVAAIGLTGQMHGLVALDKDLKPLRPVISCVDFRNARQNEEINGMFGGAEGLLPFTNNRMLPSCTGGKILWMKQNEPELYRRIRVVVNPKDYIRTALCGVPATDRSDASGFGLYDVRNHRWSGELIRRLGIDEGILPPVYASGEAVGRLLPDVAQRLGISPGAVVVAGAGDAVMQTVGSGAVSRGTYCVILGSGGLISASLSSCPRNEGAKLQLYCSALEDRWVAYAGLMSVGTSVNWFRKRFYSGPDGENAACGLERMEEEAAAVAPGAEGLLFFPALLGQRNPVEDPFARGVVVGLAPHHARGHLYRAMLEGLAFGMRDVYGLLRGIAGPAEELRLSGGGAACGLWCQIFADVFQLPVRRVRNYAVCGALGAAALALDAQAPGTTAEERFRRTAVDAEFLPDPGKREAYGALFEIYRKVYPAAAPLFAQLRRYEETFEAK